MRNRWRLMPGCHLPRLTGSNLVEDADETGYFREDGASDDLMTRHDRKFSRHLRHPGSLERGKESLWKCRLEVQPILSTLTVALLGGEFDERVLFYCNAVVLLDAAVEALS